ncbi:hypothetical protein [Scatolibacter rhodanostii]|uniref:hypothetical protein n=1 Tax=Scatolibacter rhodanostii TaxID=2014781 RepID=UPI000C08C9BC|nr:hypothetical protein [Scatolibacter rhodanostii]
MQRNEVVGFDDFIAAYDDNYQPLEVDSKAANDYLDKILETGESYTAGEYFDMPMFGGQSVVIFAFMVDLDDDRQEFIRYINCTVYVKAESVNMYN